MTAQQSWLVRQPTFWLGLLMSIAATAVAVGLVPAMGPWHQLIAGFIAICNSYGITIAHMKSPPRMSLDEMSEADRQEIFDQYPAVKARWLATHNGGK